MNITFCQKNVWTKIQYIYPPEFTQNKLIQMTKKFLFGLSFCNDNVVTTIYDKRDGFHFKLLNFSFLDRNVQKKTLLTAFTFCHSLDMLELTQTFYDFYVRNDFFLFSKFLMSWTKKNFKFTNKDLVFI